MLIMPIMPTLPTLQPECYFFCVIQKTDNKGIVQFPGASPGHYSGRIIHHHIIHHHVIVHLDVAVLHIEYLEINVLGWRIVAIRCHLQRVHTVGASCLLRAICKTWIHDTFVLPLQLHSTHSTHSTYSLSLFSPPSADLNPFNYNYIALCLLPQQCLPIQL
jgi:hypothetical protein